MNVKEIMKKSFQLDLNEDELKMLLVSVVGCRWCSPGKIDAATRFYQQLIKNFKNIVDFDSNNCFRENEK